MSAVTILQGDCLEVLQMLPSGSFDCIVTSPPYWGLRDYGVAGQIGLEPTLEGYVEALAGVACKLMRVLKPTGTFWLNLGDSYAGGKTGRGDNNPADLARRSAAYGTGGGEGCGPKTGKVRKPTDGLKPKNLCMVPARVALRLQADGWFLRSEIIWVKPNPMPESVVDRPTSAHEKIWLLTKNERYFYDAEAIKEPVVKGYAGSSFSTGKTAEHQLGRASTKTRVGQKQSEHGRRHAGFNDMWDADVANGEAPQLRNSRNVWTIAPHPFKGAHFATFPPDLVERCIKAGCPPGGSVLDPFGGAGTTGLVAERLGRRATLIELNPEYVALATARIAKAGGLNDVHPKPTTTTSDLFG
jgi:DNA modification methylase